MRPNATQYALTPTIPCGALYPSDNGTIVNGTCMVDYYEYYSYLCQMGGFTVPNQGWRFFIPIFMHMGLIQIAFTVIFQVCVENKQTTKSSEQASNNHFKTLLPLLRFGKGSPLNVI